MISKTLSLIQKIELSKAASREVYVMKFKVGLSDIAFLTERIRNKRKSIVTFEWSSDVREARLFIQRQITGPMIDLREEIICANLFDDVEFVELDFYLRTAWMIDLQTGEIVKTKCFQEDLENSKTFFFSSKEDAIQHQINDTKKSIEFYQQAKNKAQGKIDEFQRKLEALVKDSTKK